MKEESLLLLSDLQKLINQVVLIDYTIIILVGDNAFSVCEKVDVNKLQDKTACCHQGYSGLPALTNVTLSSSIKTIGRGAFFSTKALKKITIPQNVQEIEEYAFFESGLKSVTLSDGLEKIGEHAFAGTKLIGVNIPGSVYSIEPYAFSDSVSNVTINKGVKVIKHDAFGAVNATFYSKNVVITEGAFATGSVFTCYKGSTADEYAMSLR